MANDLPLRRSEGARRTVDSAVQANAGVCRVISRGWWLGALAMAVPGCLDPLIEDPGNNAAAPITPAIPTAGGNPGEMPVAPGPSGAPVTPGVTPPFTPGATPPVTPPASQPVTPGTPPTPVNPPTVTPPFTPPAGSEQASETDAEETQDIGPGAGDAGVVAPDGGFDVYLDSEVSSGSSLSTSIGSDATTGAP